MTEPNIEFITATTPKVPGYNITHFYGVVSGISFRTGMRSYQRALQTISGAEGANFIKELKEAREEAVNQAIDEAKKLGANALIGLAIETSDLGRSYITVVSVTGTAVKVELG